MIKFCDLLFANMQLSGDQEISVIVDNGIPDRMLMKSARVIYRDYYVVWFSGTMFSISKEKVFD